jgi:hypothetical protein
LHFCIAFTTVSFLETLLNRLYRSPHNQFPVFYCFFWSIYTEYIIPKKDNSMEIVICFQSHSGFCPFLDILQDYPPLQVLQSFGFFISSDCFWTFFFFFFVQKQEVDSSVMTIYFFILFLLWLLQYKKPSTLMDDQLIVK